MEDENNVVAVRIFDVERSVTVTRGSGKVSGSVDVVVSNIGMTWSNETVTVLMISLGGDSDTFEYGLCSCSFAV